MRAWPAVLACAVIIAGCSPPQMAWRDATGAGRGFDDMHADNLACYKAEMPANPESAAQAELMGGFKRIDFCMEARGWVRVRG